MEGFGILSLLLRAAPLVKLGQEVEKEEEGLYRLWFLQDLCRILCDFAKVLLFLSPELLCSFSQHWFFHNFPGIQSRIQPKVGWEQRPFLITVADNKEFQLPDSQSGKVCSTKFQWHYLGSWRMSSHSTLLDCLFLLAPIFPWLSVDWRVFQVFFWLVDQVC